jgi:hypothetical protein
LALDGTMVVMNGLILSQVLFICCYIFLLHLQQKKKKKKKTKNKKQKKKKLTCTQFLLVDYSGQFNGLDTIYSSFIEFKNVDGFDWTSYFMPTPYNGNFYKLFSYFSNFLSRELLVLPKAKPK